MSTEELVEAARKRGYSNGDNPGRSKRTQDRANTVQRTAQLEKQLADATNARWNCTFQTALSGLIASSTAERSWKLGGRTYTTPLRTSPLLLYSPTKQRKP